MTTIIDITVQSLDLPLEEPFEIALGTQTAAANLLVRIETEDGTVGYGEGSPIPPVTGETQASALAVAREARELVVGQSLTNYRSIIDTVRSTFPGAVSAQLALETALLDAYCRTIDRPLSSLFGGDTSPVSTDLTIPIVDPSEARARAESAVDQGFDHLKIKTGSDVDADIERVAAVRDGAPSAGIKVDANQGWTVSEAVRFAHECTATGVDLDLLEQPVRADDLAGLARVTSSVAVPVAADETVFSPTDAIDVVRAEAADVINVKLGKSGLLGGHDIITIAEAANLEVMIGCMLESAIGIHAAAHLVAGTEAFGYIDLDGNQLLARDVADESSGPLIEPTGPGHGIDPVLSQ